MGQQVRYGRRRSHGAGALIAAVILVVAALIAAWTLLPRLFTPRETARTAEEAYCAAVSSDGARRTLTPDQAQNAALIANIAVTRGLPDHAATVAIATAMQESRLTNLDYGDLDSLGLFQQRPSQGWGTAEQVSDMTYATNIFYDHLLQVPDWETIPVEDAAQEVQRSGYPELYAAWDAMARAWASGLTGERSAGVTCALEPATSSDADGLVAAIGGTLPNVNVSVVPPNGKTGTNNGAATNTASTTLTITLPAACPPTTALDFAGRRQAGWSRMHVNTALTHCTRTAWIGTAKPAHGSAPKPPSRPSPSRLRDVTYTAVATTNPTGWSLRRRCRLRHDTDMFLLVRMSPIHDGFDVIAIRVQHECGVIAGMVRARTGSAVVSAAGGERGCMERLHGLLTVSQERDVCDRRDRRSLRLQPFNR